jgi:hypothetical protein
LRFSKGAHDNGRLAKLSRALSQVYSKQAGRPHSLLLNVLGKDGSEDSKNYEDLT